MRCLSSCSRHPPMTIQHSIIVPLETVPFHTSHNTNSESLSDCVKIISLHVRVFGTGCKCRRSNKPFPETLTGQAQNVPLQETDGSRPCLPRSSFTATHKHNVLPVQISRKESVRALETRRSHLL